MTSDGRTKPSVGSSFAACSYRGQLPVLEHRGRTGDFAPYDGRVESVDQYLGTTERGELARPAHMVLVEVGEHDPPYVPGIPAERGHRLGDRGAVARRTGVDQRQFVAVAPEVGLADRGTQEVQAGEKLDDVHGTTVERPPPAGEGLCRGQSGQLAA